jgi:phosphatidylglycerophosphate synthase
MSADESFSSALRRLSTAQKPPKGVPLYLRFVNRPAGRVVAAAAYQAGLTPNTVTAMSACLTASGIALIAIAPPSPLAGLAVAIALAAGFAFDSADGQLARLRGAGSPSGEWLDHVVDAAKQVVLPAAVLIAWVRLDTAQPWLLLPLLAQLVSVMLYTGGLLHDKIAGRPQASATASGSKRRALLMLPVDYGVTCWLFLLWGWQGAFQIAWALLVAAQAVLTGLFLRHWFADLKADRGQSERVG